MVHSDPALKMLAATPADPTTSLNWPTGVALGVALAGPPSLVVASRGVFGDSPDMGAQTLMQVIFCALAAFVVLVVRRFERLPLRSIGLRRPGWSTISTALLLVGVGFVLQALVTAPLVSAFAREGADAGMARLAAMPVWFRPVVAVTSGVVEETLYRGYAVERLAAITGRTWLGATLATVAFGAAHIPFWGFGFALVADLPYGVLLVLFYLWRRDLLANMLGHSAALTLAFVTTVPRAV